MDELSPITYDIRVGEGKDAFIVESWPPLENCEEMSTLEWGVAPSHCAILNKGKSQAFGFPKQLFSTELKVAEAETASGQPLVDQQRKRFIEWIHVKVSELTCLCPATLDETLYDIGDKHSLFAEVVQGFATQP